MFTRRISLALMAAACLAVVAIPVDRAAALYRRTVDAIYFGFRWLVARMPRPLQNLQAWRRVQAMHEVIPRTQLGTMRRPAVYPSWRMCPST